MPTYTMTGPDGKDYSIDGPAGASPDQVQAELQKQFSARQPAPVAQQQAVPTDPGALQAFAGGANTAMLGIPTAIAAGARALWNGTNINDEVNNVHAMSSAAESAHPLTSIAGNVVGSIPLAAGAELALAPKLGALALKEGAPIANLARLAVRGAIGGGVVGGAQGAAAGAESGAQANGVTGAVTGAAEGGAEGAAAGAATGAPAGVLGAAVAKGGQAVLKAFAGPSQRAIALLAKHLDMSPSQVAQGITDFRNTTGRPPAIADILQAKDQANLKPFTTAYQSSKGAMQTAADANTAALPKNLSDEIAGSGTTNTPLAAEPTLATARSAPLAQLQQDQMDATMKPIRNQNVLVDSNSASVIDNPLVRRAVSDDPVLKPRIAQAVNTVSAPSVGQNGASVVHGDLTVDDFDALRQALRTRQSYALASFRPKLAEQYGAAADQVTQFASNQVPEYGNAMADYARQSRFMAGFDHGYAGKSPADAPATGDRTTFSTPEGAAGLELGARSRLMATAGASEGGAQRVADLLRQNISTPATDVLPSAQVASLRDIGQAETNSQTSHATLAGASLPSKSSEATAQVTKALGATVAAAGHGSTGFGFHAITAFLKGQGVRESTANELVSIINSKDATMLKTLPAKLTAANVSAAAQRKILGAVSQYTGAGAGAVAGQAANGG